MPRYFTYYWRNEFCNSDEEEETSKEYLTHLGGNRFLKRGIKPGDFVYLVTVKKGELFLLGRMEVGEICDRNEAARLLDCQPDELWDAQEHLVAKASSAIPIQYNRWVPLDVTQRLKFTNRTGGSPQPLRFEAPGVLDRQTLRSVRELTREAATELDKILDQGENLEAC